MKIRRVLIANRGEIAVRIAHACRALEIGSVLAVSEADRTTMATRLVDRTVCIGPAWPMESYLDIDRLIMAAQGTGCDALHPGYGFLAESPQLARSCQEHDIVFVGPDAEQISQMGNKIQARTLAQRFGVPTLPGSARVQSLEHALEVAREIGFPVIVKAAAGGGGRGMRLVRAMSELPAVFAATAAEAEAAFGDGALYIERFIANARHIEVQILADAHGNVVHLGDRDCSFQRRHQKLVEEAPAPGIEASLRNAIHDAAVTFARRFGYRNAGTVEFILDQDADAFYFLEMNTRIQVEHPVTEMLTGIDLVQEQFRIAAGEPLRYTQEDIVFRGHAIECRITAELASRGFRPSPGRIRDWQAPQGPNIRVDTHCYAGYEVPLYYDSLLAKLVVYGMNREEAIARMRSACRQFVITGIDHTADFQRQLVSSSRFQAGTMNTGLVDRWLAGDVGALED